MFHSRYIFKVETFVKVITKCQSFCLYCRVGFCCKLGAKFLKIFGLAHSSLNFSYCPCGSTSLLSLLMSSVLRVMNNFVSQLVQGQEIFQTTQELALPKGELTGLLTLDRNKNCRKAIFNWAAKGLFFSEGKGRLYILKLL